MPMGTMIRAAPRATRRRGLNYKQVKQVQKIVNKNKQLKSQQDIASQAVTTAKYLYEITEITEGDDFNQRTSDKIFLQSLKINMSINQAGTLTQQLCRVMVVRGKNGPLSTADLPAYSTEADLDKMQVYYDRIVRIPATAIDPIQWDFFKSFRNKKVPHLKVRYDDDVSAISAEGNPIYVYAVSSEGTNGFVLSVNSKVKWFDA